jgi:hypothetical protein
MAAKIRRVEYFFVTVPDQPGEACRVLSELAHHQVNLVGFAAVPVGPASTQLTIFPEETGQFVEAARLAGLHLGGPHHAFLVQGDDELGSLAEIHEQLFEADVNVWASQGVADGRGSFGYIIYVRPEHYELAAAALSVTW